MGEQRPSSTAEAVQLYRRLGLVPVPVAPGKKAPARPRWTQPKNWDFAGGENVGLLLGHPSRLADVDVDDLTAAAVAEATSWPRVLGPGAGVARFGRRGKPVSHLLFRQDGAIPRKFADPETRKVLVEVRGDGQQTVVPPSTHPSGEVLAWLDDPAEALSSLNPVGTAERAAAFIAVATVAVARWGLGVRHDLALGLAGWLLKAGWGDEAVRELLRVVCEVASDPEREDRLRLVDDTRAKLGAGEPVSGLARVAEVLGPKVARALARFLGGEGEERPLELTDEGVALGVVARGNLKWHVAAGKWLCWSGAAWEESTEAAVLAELQRYRSDLRTVGNPALEKSLKSYEMYPRVRAVMELARRVPGAQVLPDELDSDPWLLNCPNGTVDLKTGELRPHRREDLITRTCGAPYDPGAKAPLFLDMLRRATGSEAVVNYLRLAAGLTAIGLSSKNVFVVYGPTNTGKTTFLTKCLAAALGTYAVEVPAWVLSSAAVAGERAVWLVATVGARLVTVSEPPEHVILDPAVIKSASGDNVLVVRSLYHMPTSFRPRFTVWVDTNYMPVVPESDDAVWTRLKLVHFKHRVRVNPGEDGWVEAFNERLRAELPGILAWVISGAVEVAREWDRTHGQIPPPQEVIQATEAWHDEEDVIQTFLDDEVVHREGAVLPRTVLWRRFQEWWRRSVPPSRPMPGKTTLFQELRRRGWVDVKRQSAGHRDWLWLNAALKRDGDEENVTGELRI